MKQFEAKVTLRAGRESSIKRLHPWIFSGAIDGIDGDQKPGSVVEVYSSKGEFLGVGHYEGTSLAIKILSFKKIPIDDQFFEARFLAALETRRDLGLLDSAETNSFRLICGEGDLLPGLIIDFYNGHCVVQCHSAGMLRSRELIVNSLSKVFGDKLLTIFARNHDTLPDTIEENLRVNEFWKGDSPGTKIIENGLKFKVDWQNGQKTGFYLDQRENRKILQEIVSEKSVLNMFSFTGGFTLSAFRGGAKSCDSVDSSAWALDQLKENLALNQMNLSGEVIERDCFKFLEGLDKDYGCIVLDPPPFAKSKSALEKALGGYKALNYHAVKHLERGGLLMTFSCSQVVSRGDFKKSVSLGLAQAGRSASILRELNAAPCHVHSLHHPEGEYLKGLLLKVN